MNDWLIDWLFGWLIDCVVLCGRKEEYSKDPLVTLLGPRGRQEVTPRDKESELQGRIQHSDVEMTVNELN